MTAKRGSILETKFFYVSSIFAVSLGIVSLMLRFKTVNWILVVFGLAWVIVVTAFAWEIVTRAETLDAVVKARTDALEESNRNLAALLEQLNAFHAISYEMNQKMELSQITRTFADRLARLLPGVEGVWLWLEPGLLQDQEVPQQEGERVPLELAAQSGTDFGKPAELNPLGADNPLAARCFDARSVAVDHNLQTKARAWGWKWLAGTGIESSVAFPLEVGGRMLGVLGLFARRAISAEFVSHLHPSVNQLAVALEKARLLKETSRRAEQLAAANEELRQLDAMKDWFVSSVSHELRTPLTNIRSFGEILESYGDLTPDERKEFAAIIRQESERLSRMINDVLDLAKMADGEAGLKPACFDLRSVVGRCCKLFSQEAQDRNLAFVQSLPEELPQVYADESGVARVLNNLIANALKFTPDGGRVQVTAELTAARQAGGDGPGCVTVLVSDTGIGIPLRDQTKVFDRFTQVGSGLTSKTPGTGIGLAICREIVEKSNGEIWVQSRPNEGSTFGFTLPLAPAA